MRCAQQAQVWASGFRGLRFGVWALGLTVRRRGPASVRFKRMCEGFSIDVFRMRISPDRTSTTLLVL